MTENDLFGAADVPDDMTRPLAVLHAASDPV